MRTILTKQQQALNFSHSLRINFNSKNFFVQLNFSHSLWFFLPLPHSPLFVQHNIFCDYKRRSNRESAIFLHHTLLGVVHKWRSLIKLIFKSHNFYKIFFEAEWCFRPPYPSMLDVVRWTTPTKHKKESFT